MKAKRSLTVASTVFVVLVLVAVSFIAACAKPAPPPTPTPTPAPTPTPTPAPPPAAPETIKWTLQPTVAWVPPPLGPYEPYIYHNVLFYGLNDWLKEATDGRLEIEILAPGEVFPIYEALSAVGAGATDCSHTPPGYFGGEIPEMNILSGLPGAWTTTGEVVDALFNTYGMYDKTKGLFDQYNTIFIPIPIVEVMNFFCTFPMPSPDSIKGHKIRSWGPYHKYVTMLGGSSVSIPYTEVYMAIKLGTIEGTTTGAQALEDTKLKEVVTDCVGNVTSCCAGFLINKDSFEALPEDIQELLMRESIWYFTFAGLEHTQQHLYTVQHAAEEYGIEVWMWGEEDQTKIREQAVEEIWPEFAEKTPLCAELVEILKQQFRDLGKLK